MYNYKREAVCTITLAVMNVVVFFGLSFFGMTEDAEFMLKHGAMYVPDLLSKGNYYTLFTSMFLHFGFEHLMNNMVILLLLGLQLEHELGKVKYVLLYLISGIGGNLLSMAWEIHTGDYAVSAGASGAIFGIIAALFYVAVRNRGHVGNMSSKGLIFMVLLSLYYGFTSTGVDNAAHIGGLITGLLLAVLLYRKPKRKSSAEIWG